VTSIPIMKEKTEKIGIHVAEILVEVRVFMFVVEDWKMKVCVEKLSRRGIGLTSARTRN